MVRSLLHQKLNGGFVIPINTPSTKSQGGLFGRRVKKQLQKVITIHSKDILMVDSSVEEKGSVRTGFNSKITERFG